ncbi:hypothetical protein J3R30DRAFT_3502516 [Lentinula aciculospora]|uniref:Uncharacterized protein n=1 Tax=Lentinula aciculospora TaxID=153920 RepID=A0A9W9A7W7_9AGAR|nr:hypothetical protein J3R30DRAFT_3502516 [Lentinula aciculospora]
MSGSHTKDPILLSHLITLPSSMRRMAKGLLVVAQGLVSLTTASTLVNKAKSNQCLLSGPYGAGFCGLLICFLMSTS